MTFLLAYFFRNLCHKNRLITMLCVILQIHVLAGASISNVLAAQRQVILQNIIFANFLIHTCTPHLN